MRKIYLLLLVLFFGGQSINAQELVPRFYWVQMFDTLDVETYSKAEIQQSMDSIDFTTVTEEEIKYIEKYFDPFQKRWMAKYGNNIPEINAATGIYVGGMDCDRCLEVVIAEILDIEGVEKIMESSLETDIIVYHYYNDYESSIRDIVFQTLSKNLEGCGYAISQTYEKDFPEVKEVMRQDSILKLELGTDKCFKHE